MVTSSAVAVLTRDDKRPRNSSLAPCKSPADFLTLASTHIDEEPSCDEAHRAHKRSISTSRQVSYSSNATTAFSVDEWFSIPIRDATAFQKSGPTTFTLLLLLRHKLNVELGAVLIPEITSSHPVFP